MTVGKTEFAYLVTGIETYQKRIGKYVSFEIHPLSELKNTRNLSIDEIKLREGQVILRSINPTDFVVLLDERGKQHTSPSFAQFIAQLQMRNIKQVVFIVGGAFGFSSAVYDRANETISLSSMTFSHQLVRLLFVEQLYRAYSILHHEPYHH